MSTTLQIPSIRQRIKDLLNDHKYSNAIPLLLKLKEKSCDNKHKILNKIASIYKKLNDFKNAIKYYKQSIHINSSYCMTYNELGMLYQELNDIKNAKTNYLQCIYLDNKNIYALFNLAKLSMQFREYTESDKYFKLCLLNEQTPKASVHYHYSILLNDYLNEPYKALYHIGIAIEIKPDITNYHFQHALISIHLNDCNITHKIFKKALELSTYCEPKILFQYGLYFQRDLKDNQSAMKYFEMAYNLQTNNKQYELYYFDTLKVLQSLTNKNRFPCRDNTYYNNTKNRNHHSLNMDINSNKNNTNDMNNMDDVKNMVNMNGINNNNMCQQRRDAPVLPDLFGFSQSHEEYQEFDKESRRKYAERKYAEKLESASKMEENAKNYFLLPILANFYHQIGTKLGKKDYGFDCDADFDIDRKGKKGNIGYKQQNTEKNPKAIVSEIMKAANYKMNTHYYWKSMPMKINGRWQCSFYLNGKYITNGVDENRRDAAKTKCAINILKIFKSHPKYGRLIFSSKYGIKISKKYKNNIQGFEFPVHLTLNDRSRNRLNRNRYKYEINIVPNDSSIRLTPYCDDDCNKYGLLVFYDRGIFTNNNFDNPSIEQIYMDKWHEFKGGKKGNNVPIHCHPYLDKNGCFIGKFKDENEEELWKSIQRVYTVDIDEPIQQKPHINYNYNLQQHDHSKINDKSLFLEDKEGKDRNLPVLKDKSLYKQIALIYCTKMNWKKPIEITKENENGFGFNAEITFDSIINKPKGNGYGLTKKEAIYNAYIKLIPIVIPKQEILKLITKFRVEHPKCVLMEWSAKNNKMAPKTEYIAWNNKNGIITWIARVTFCGQTVEAKDIRKKDAERKCCKMLLKYIH